MAIEHRRLGKHGVLVSNICMAAMGKPKTKVADLCRELGVTRQTLYRHVSPAGNLREDGRRLLKTKRR